jgi:hypothetical protein
MESYTVAVFGEAEKGDFQTAYYCDNLPQLVDCFGNPPKDSHGLYFAVQALLFHRHIIFLRVREEGFSQQDYFVGLKLLERRDLISHLEAIGLPGVGDAEIIDAVVPVCQLYHSVLLTTEADFFDYVTHSYTISRK